MNFSTTDKIASVIDSMRTAEIRRAQQRELLDSFFNGDRPWTDKEAEQNHILFNFNDKSGAILLHAARAQYENAFMKSADFFKLEIDGPPDKAIYWNSTVTQAMNRQLKGSRTYLHLMRSKFAGVVLHGIGPQVWWDEQDPIAGSIGIQDLLIPTDTEVTLENLQYFSVRRKMRPGDLFKKTFGLAENRRLPGWNLPVVSKILDDFKDLNQNPHNYDWANNPEQMAELYKQNLTYYDADSAPVIWMQEFCYREEGLDDKREPGWYKVLLLDKDNTAVNIDSFSEDGKPPFLYKRKVPFGSTLDQLLHIQFGDGNNVPPFMYHSIRSLGYLLYELMWTMNRLNCQFTQHVFEQLMSWFRVTDPADRGRLEKIMMSGPFAIIPDGLSMVTNNERYKADPNMVTLLQQQYKQKVGEASSAYTQQIENGTQKERTKFEVEAIMSQISALMSSMLTLAYNQEYFSFVEIARRFAIKDSRNFMVKHFRQECLSKGVPPKYLDSERWTIKPEQVLGSGNKMLELAQARELRSMRPTLNPQAQLEVDRIYITSLTDNARLAQTLVPQAPTLSDSVHDAQLAFGSLMQGVEVGIKEGFSHIEEAGTVLQLMQQVVARINATGGVGTAQDIIGLKTAAVYAAKHIGIIAQDEQNKPLVKQFGDQLGNIMNMVKAFAQRQSQAGKSNGNGNGQPPIDPETIAKIRGSLLMDQIKAKSKDAQAKQRLVHQQAKFMTDLNNKAAQAKVDAQIKVGQAMVDAHNGGMKNRFGAFNQDDNAE